MLPLQTTVMPRSTWRSSSIPISLERKRKSCNSDSMKCWLFNGSVNTDGYGQIGVNVRSRMRCFPCHFARATVVDGVTTAFSYCCLFSLTIFYSHRQHLFSPASIQTTHPACPLIRFFLKQSYIDRRNTSKLRVICCPRLMKAEEEEECSQVE